MRIGVLLMASLMAAGSVPQERSRAIGDLVARYQRLGYLNGAVLVAEHGQVLYAGGVGAADMEKHVANTAETRFGIASITKQFTAALVLQQVEQGRVRLDGKLSDYLPWYRKDSGGRITIEELLHHTSGLPADFDEPENSDTPEASKHDVPDQFARKSCQKNLAAEPGEKWAYSNCGYILLGLVLEQVTGEPYEKLLHERLLDPLGMRNTGMDHNDLVQRGGAVGYVRLAGPRYKRGPYIDQGHIFSAGSMYSTVEDLQRWSDALEGGAVITSRMRDAIFTPGKGDWGYGWFVTKLPDGGTLEEMRGDMPGNYFAWIRRYPERDAVIIVLRNAYGSTERFEENLEAILMGRDPHVPGRNVKDIAASFWFAWGRWGVLVFGALVAAFAVAQRFGWCGGRRRELGASAA
ncbi:MAG: hypothetical protein NVS9B15_11850 [Acidobacteriaceae bacterium]